VGELFIFVEAEYLYEFISRCSMHHV